MAARGAADNWEFFHCRMGEDVAYVMVNISIGERIARVAAPHLLIAKVVYPEPRDNGLPSSQDFARLNLFEDALKAGLDGTADCLVGRVTTAGARDFYIYTVDDSESLWRQRLEPIAALQGLTVRPRIQHDPEHNGYWQGLYPGDEDWRVIANLRLTEQLKSDGDDFRKSRRIDHVAYFPSRRQAERFAAAIPALGFALESETPGESDNGKFCVAFTHVGTLENADLTHYTLSVFRAAREQGGEYDGWGTAVTK